jgi:hypothetical protein
MATIAKSGVVSISTPAPDVEHSLSGLYAGEAISAGDACYIKTSDGRLWRSNGNATGVTAVIDGFAASDAVVGDAVTLYYGVRFRYGTGLTPGTYVYLDSTPGGLSDVVTTGGLLPIGRVIDTTRIDLNRTY